MRFEASTLVALFGVLTIITNGGVLEVTAKKPSRSRSAATSRHRSSASSSRGPAGSRPRVSQRRKVSYEEEEEDVVDEFEQPGFLDDGDDDEEEMEDEEEEDDYVPRKSGKSRRPPSRTSRETAMHASGGRRRPPPSRYDDEDEENDYRPKSRSRASSSSARGPRPRPGGRSGVRPGPGPRGRPAGRRPGSVVPYTRHKEPSFLARSFDAVKSSMPDPSTIREVASNSLNVAKATTSSLSANIYREIKGLTSSELEQVLLKATRPDDGAVKGKHVERLVSVTYQISSRYDIYDAVLRKLWSKMAEKDWRTKVKALYILHRFSADGAPEHAAALKARLRELRRTRDPKRKDKYFNSKQLLAGESKPENMKFRAFMSRYAHYVILRAQCFGGVFDEISAEPKVDKKKPPKPITSTALRGEHLEAAVMLFKAGLACQLRDGEECENTAIAAERVASDLIGLTAAVAIQLNRVLKDEDLKGGDPALIKKWCELYKKQLLPQTKAHVKKLASKLDAYGLFLPSRMGTSVSQELLERGLNLEEEEEDEEDDEEADEGSTGAKQSSSPAKETDEDDAADEDDDDVDDDEDDGEDDDDREEETASRPARRSKVERADDDEDDADEDGFDDDDDEYEYDDEEYYDDED